MSILKALIFDVDGTLADTERDGHRVAFNRAFQEAGLDWDWSIDTYRDLLVIAGGKERIQHYCNTYCPEFQPDLELKEWAATLHKTKTKHYRQLLAEGIIPLRPGVKRLIQEARAQNIRLAIATTSTLENVLALLETTLGPDSPSWFEVIAAGDIVSTKKPAPDIYLYVLQKMQLPPQECIAIEDSDQGLRAALQAGLTTVITINGYTQHHDFSNAVLVLDHLGEPEQPFQAIMGHVGEATHLNLTLLQSLLESKL